MCIYIYIYLNHNNLIFIFIKSLRLIEDNGVRFQFESNLFKFVTEAVSVSHLYRVQIFIWLSDDYNTTLPSTLVSFLDRQKSESKKLNHNYFFLRANIVLIARLKATLDSRCVFLYVSSLLLHSDSRDLFSPPRLIIDKLNRERVSSNRLQGFGLIFRFPLICTLGRYPPICIRLDPKHNLDPPEILD